MPAGPVEDEDAMGAGAHRLRDLVQVPLHGRGVALDQIVIWSAEKYFTKKIWIPDAAECLGRLG